MFCKNCGKQSMDDARFCRFCGYEFKNAVQPKQVSQPQTGRYAGRPKNKKPIFGVVFAAIALILIRS